MNRTVGHQRMHTKCRAIAHASCVGSIVSIIYPRIICARLSNHWVENRAVFFIFRVASQVLSWISRFLCNTRQNQCEMRIIRSGLIRLRVYVGWISRLWIDFREMWKKRINGFVDAVQSTLLKWIDLEPHHQHPLSQTIHLSVLYIWHCV